MVNLLMHPQRWQLDISIQHIQKRRKRQEKERKRGGRRGERCCCLQLVLGGILLMSSTKVRLKCSRYLFGYSWLIFDVFLFDGNQSSHAGFYLQHINFITECNNPPSRSWCIINDLIYQDIPPFHTLHTTRPCDALSHSRLKWRTDTHSGTQTHK